MREVLQTDIEPDGFDEGGGGGGGGGGQNPKAARRTPASIVRANPSRIW